MDLNKILSKVKEVEECLPASFPDKVTPNLTNNFLNQFTNYIGQFMHYLNEIKIPQELFDAENFIAHQKYEFDGLEKSITNPEINKNQKLYSAEELMLICLDEYKQLAVQTNFVIDNKFNLNFNKLEVNSGPYYIGSSYDVLKVRIVNFTNEIITCKYHQKNQITDLFYENEHEFFNLIFPLDKIVMEYKDTKFHFTGTIDFYEPNSEESFKKIPYDICLHFMLPTMFFKVKKFSLAIKDGCAQILPCYVVQESNITIEYIPNLIQVNTIELPENTAKRPTIRNANDKFSLKFPSIYDKQIHFASQFDFSLSNHANAPILFNFDIKEKKIGLFMYCDTRKDFLENGANVNIGNLWRNIYVLIVFFNINEVEVDAIFEFDRFTSEYYVIKQEEAVKFAPYNFSAEIVSFKARLTNIPFKRISEFNKLLKVKIRDISASIKFNLHLDYIYIDTKRSAISGNKYLDFCSYWDENKFVKYVKNKKYYIKDENIIVSPISYNTYTRDTMQLLSIRFDDFGEFKYIRNSGETEFEILVLDPSSNEQIKIINRFGNKIHHKIGGAIKLFGRIKNKPNIVFPLFGIGSRFKHFDIPTNCDLLYSFIELSNTLLEEKYRYTFLGVQDNELITFSLPSVYNFAYIIYFLVPYMQSLRYVSILIPEIIKFTNIATSKNIYNSELRLRNLTSKFILFIGFLFDTMSTLYNEIKLRNFIVDINFPFEKILEEQEKQMKEMNLDKSSAESSKTYITIKNQNYFEIYNKSKRNEFIKNGYAISQYAKWTFENKFKEIKEDEYLKAKEIHAKYISLNLEYPIYTLPDFSFDNMNSILNVYKTFDSVLTNVYEFTVSLNYCLIKNDQNQLDHHVKILNQLVSFFLWANRLSDYSQYRSFCKKFFPAYQSMMSCLKNAGFLIRINHFKNVYNNFLSNDVVFISKPDNQPIFYVWKQLGLIENNPPKNDKA